MADIFGTDGPDFLYGSDDYDFIYAGAGDDYIDAGSGNANITAGPGSDTIVYSSVTSGFANLFHTDLTGGIYAYLSIDDNAAYISSGGDTDTIVDIQRLFESYDGIFIDGTQYDDTFYISHTAFSDGQLIIRPGDGVDSYYIDADIQGQMSNTRLYFEDAEEGAVINLTYDTEQIQNDGYGNVETISGPGYIRQFFLTHHDDIFVGGDGDERIVGYSGNDYIDGGGGVDRIDFIVGFSSVVVNLEEGWATGTSFNPFAGDGGEDTTFSYALANIEDVSGSGSAADDITGSEVGNILRGRGGDDTISGLGGNDTLRGDEGNDVLDGGDGNDVLQGGDDEDVLIGGIGDDTLNGGQGGDLFVFDFLSGSDVIEDFEQGTDRLDFREFADVLAVGGRKVLALDLSDAVIGKLLATSKFKAGFDILDSNLDSVLDENDDAIDLVNGGEDILIDLGAAYGGVAGTSTVLISDVVSLTFDDFIF